MCRAAASTLSSQARWGKPRADGRTNSPAVRRLLAHALILFSCNLPIRMSANHVRLPCHAGFTRNRAGSAGEPSGAGLGRYTQCPDEARGNHHVSGDEVMDRRPAEPHHHRVDSSPEDVEHVLDTGLTLGPQPPEIRAS